MAWVVELSNNKEVSKFVILVIFENYDKKKIRGNA